MCNNHISTVEIVFNENRQFGDIKSQLVYSARRLITRLLTVSDIY